MQSVLKKTTSKSGVFEFVLLIIIYGIIISLTTYRLFYGIEITDEAHYIAEAHIITQGATPFVNIWSQSPGFALLNAPLVWLYTFIFSSTDGIFLYFRLMCLFIKILFICAAIYIMRPIMDLKIVAIWLLPLIAFTPHSVVSLSYNTWSIILFMFACLCLTRASLSENKQEKKRFGINAGLSCALAILSYPLTIIVGCFLLIAIWGYDYFYTEHKNKYEVTLSFLLGGLLTASLISLLFIVRTGEISGIYNGIKIIIYDNPYHKLSKNITKDSITLMLGYYKIWLKFISVFLLVFFIPKINKKHKVLFVLICTLYFVSRDSFYLFYPNFQRLYQSLPMPQITSVLCRQLFFVPLLIFPYLLSNRKNQVIALIFFLYFPALIQTLTASLLAYSGMNRRYYFLFQGTLLITPFIYWVISDILKNEKFKRVSEFSALFSSILCSLTISAVFLLNYYGYMYRDEPITKLNYKVESGIYKGLYTTREKGKGLEALEKTIRLKTSSSDKILFMDCVPMAYLMTDARHCAPSTWDIQLYSYKFTEDTLLRKYFKTIGQTPDKILYIFTGRDGVLSIDSEDYKFNDFVNANYDLTSNIDAFYPIKIYERIVK